MLKLIFPYGLFLIIRLIIIVYPCFLIIMRKVGNFYKIDRFLKIKFIIKIKIYI